MIIKFLKKYAWIYIPGIVFLALNSRVKTLVPKALGEAIDLLKVPDTPAGLVYHQALLIFLLAFLIFATQFVWRMCVIGNARRLECFLREEYFIKLQSLPMSFFSKHGSGDLMAYAINDVGAVRMTFGPVLAMGINGIITGALSIFSMAGEIDSRLTLFALLPVPVAVVAIVVLGKMVQSRFKRVQELFARISGFVNESIMGVRVVKAFARESQWEKEFNGLSEKMQQANVRLADISALINPIVAVSFGLSYAVSLIYGGQLVMEGQLELGELVAFQGYLLLVQTPVMQLGRIINMIQRGLASYQRLREIYDEKGLPEEETRPYPRAIKGSIRVSHLTYTYPGRREAALQDVSFELPEGCCLGIAGATGCGKTTLLNLLLKFYPAPDGTISIDGTDINQIPAFALRGACGYVSQDGFLFSSSIEENIRFYMPGIGLEEVRQAARTADIDEEIMRFPEQYRTQVGERGTHLSGGQKQRISLARALVRKPRILLLDDTLSAVDNVTEKNIIGNLKTSCGENTSIIVSHRLSAIAHADIILYMENGKIVEQGTHDQLMAKGGQYASTYLKQEQGREGEQ